MRRVSFLAVLVLAAAGLPVLPRDAAAFQEFKNMVTVSPLAEGDQWFLRANLDWLAKSGETVCVPQNFVTDFASIPRPFWALMPRWEGYGPAAVVHDYLYWNQPGSRREADEFMLEAMEDQNVGWLKSRIVYAGVRTFGWFAWRSNAKEKGEGFRRVIPEEQVPEDPTTTWEALREAIKETSASETCDG